MSEGQIISLVSVLGALILVGSGLRRRRLGGRTMLTMALIWIGIFILVTVVFGSMQ